MKKEKSHVTPSLHRQTQGNMFNCLCACGVQKGVPEQNKTKKERKKKKKKKVDILNLLPSLD